MSNETPIRRLFPTASRELHGFAGIWDVEVDPQTVDGIGSLYNLIIFLENESQRDGPDALVMTARALRSDLLSLDEQRPGPIAESDLHSLLIATTLGPAGFAIATGRYNMAYDWLLWSLTTTWEIDGEHILHIEWLPSILQSRISDAADEIVRPWLQTLYQYDLKMAGLPAVTEALFPTALAIAVDDLPVGQFELAGVLLGWAGNQRLGLVQAAELHRICDFLADIVDNAALSSATRMRALRPLALCSPAVTGQDQCQRAAQLLDQFESELNTTDRLAALGTSLSGRPEDTAAQIEAFLDLARDHHAQFTYGAGSEQDAAWARSGMHSLIDVPVRTLLMGGHVRLAVRLLRAWRGLEDDLGDEPNTLFAVLANAHGFSWVADGGAVYGPPAGVSLSDFQLAANAFLGNTVTVRTGPTVPLHVPSRGRGVPNDDQGAAFEVVAHAFLNLSGAEAAHASAVETPSSLLALPTLQAPLQPLMLRNLGWTLPLSMSLRKPKPDRPIRQALLYVGGSLFSPLEMEALEASLSSTNVRVTVRDAHEMTSARFLADYHSAEFDLIWVGTHGVYDALEPDRAYLHLSELERVTLKDLRPPVTGLRRLLVLNACDGGATALMGGVGEIGLAATASAAAQAVISHHWPIKSPTVAPVFAAVLAGHLGVEQTYFEAYQATVSTFEGGQAALQTQLENISERLVHVVQDHPQDFDALTGWASAAFFE